MNFIFIHQIPQTLSFAFKRPFLGSIFYFNPLKTQNIEFCILACCWFLIHVRFIETEKNLSWIEMNLYELWTFINFNWNSFFWCFFYYFNIIMFLNFFRKHNWMFLSWWYPTSESTPNGQKDLYRYLIILICIYYHYEIANFIFQFLSSTSIEYSKDFFISRLIQKILHDMLNFHFHKKL